ncbi:hypothetical protein [Chamaesiphon sp.]|uniref:hypothetical protein n=1 Tax=Chamaesiphon sp. TaxID=2814140 RepID=UPI0035933C29
MRILLLFTWILFKVYYLPIATLPILHINEPILSAAHLTNCWNNLRHFLLDNQDSI